MLFSYLGKQLFLKCNGNHHTDEEGKKKLLNVIIFYENSFWKILEEIWSITIEVNLKKKKSCVPIWIVSYWL